MTKSNNGERVNVEGFYIIITQNGFLMFTLNVTTIYLAPKKVNVSSNVKCFWHCNQKIIIYVQKSWPFIERMKKYNLGMNASQCEVLCKQHISLATFWSIWKKSFVMVEK
jgi:hypothetical protein